MLHPKEDNRVTVYRIHWRRRGRRGGLQKGAVTGQVRAGTGGNGSGEDVEVEECQVGATGV